MEDEKLQLWLTHPPAHSPAPKRGQEPSRKASYTCVELKKISQIKFSKKVNGLS